MSKLVESENRFSKKEKEINQGKVEYLRVLGCHNIILLNIKMRELVGTRVWNMENITK